MTRPKTPILVVLAGPNGAGKSTVASSSSPDVAVARVADRVKMGGHDVPESTIRRRYRTGILNLFRLYRRLATSWALYDNSSAAASGLRLIGEGSGETVRQVGDASIWARLQERYGHGC